MQNIMGSRQPAPSDDRDHIYRAVVADLASLIEHIQASLTMIESALAKETSAAIQDMAANVIVLDDVTPRYLKAGAALKACDAGLGMAMHLLRELMASESGISHSTNHGHGSALALHSPVN